MQLPQWVKTIGEIFQAGQAIAWLLGVPIISGILAWITKAPSWGILLAVIGAAFLISSVLLYKAILKLLFNEHTKKEESITKNLEELPKNHIEFFKDRPALERRQPVLEIFKFDNKIYGYFPSGEGLFSLNKGNIRYYETNSIAKAGWCIFENVCSVT